MVIKAKCARMYLRENLYSCSIWLNPSVQQYPRLNVCKSFRPLSQLLQVASNSIDSYSRLILTLSLPVENSLLNPLCRYVNIGTGWTRIIPSYASAKFCFGLYLSGNLNQTGNEYKQQNNKRKQLE